MDRMRVPLDQSAMKLVAKQVWERRKWDTDESGRRYQTDEQVKTKDGRPMWEIVCVNVSNKGPDTLRVVVASDDKPAFEGGESVAFDSLDATFWVGKNGIGADYWASGVKAA